VTRSEPFYTQATKNPPPGPSLTAFFVLEVASRRVALEPGEMIVETQTKEGLEVVEDGGLMVAVDTRVSDELRQEGIARDFVRHIQVLRKESGLEVQDCIRVQVDAEGIVKEALARHQEVVQGETLAETMTLGSVTLDGGRQFQLGEQMISVVLRKSEEG
jgi:formylmethanofuran dehydrogenase subunit C